MTPFLYLLLFLLLLLLVLMVVRHFAYRRQNQLTRILDLADELEALYKETGRKMDAMKLVVQRVPSDIAAVANASLQSQEQIQQGLRNVLEHRLWLARHANTAKIRELKVARQALERSRAAIAGQLQRLDSAGEELTVATDAAVAQAEREPESLRRPADGRGRLH
ncbi:MAG: hypothetical protein KDI75_09330 [Xanthomonadales bacterium]|nr:hypothetical protein [Xanthomonadales bacterium]